MGRAPKAGASRASGFVGKDWFGIKRGSVLDSAIAIGVAVLLIGAVRFFWTRFPHPVETSTLLLGLSAMLATGVAFGKRRKEQPFSRQALTFAVIMAFAQATIQLASTRMSF